MSAPESDASALWQYGHQYTGAPLDPAACDRDPIAQFRTWFADAVAANAPTVNAMTLATVDDRARPAARIVLLKEVDARGFVFFTNYASKKGQELAVHPFAALVFHWESLHRQVRVEGTVEKIAAAESDAYFAVRPRGSQLGAIVSPQSQVIAARGELEARVAALEVALGGGAPTRPDDWGGYRVVADAVEFWQGQPSRLHDRVRYQKLDGSTEWRVVRLAP